jgi:hypothetical protein
MINTNKYHIKLLRVDQSEQATLGHLYINGVFACYTLEDALRKDKIAGQSAIPVGSYNLRLNTWGGKNEKYTERFPEMHQGMLEIAGNIHYSFDGFVDKLLINVYFRKPYKITIE